MRSDQRDRRSGMRQKQESQVELNLLAPQYVPSRSVEPEFAACACRGGGISCDSWGLRSVAAKVRPLQKQIRCLNALNEP